MTNDPIQWGRAEVAWTPTGYRLTLPVWLDARGSALFEARVGDLLESLEELGEGAVRVWTFEHGHIHRTKTEVRADPGLLRITAPRTLFALEPARLQDVLGALAATCRREGDEQQDRDEEIAGDWLGRVRVLSTDGLA